jgi:hypothetical protein
MERAGRVGDVTFPLKPRHARPRAFARTAGKTAKGQEPKFEEAEQSVYVSMAAMRSLNQTLAKAYRLTECADFAFEP